MRAIQCDRCLRWIEASCTFCRHCGHSWLEQIARTKEEIELSQKKRLAEKELNMEGTQEKYEFEYCNLIKAHELSAKSHIKTAYKMLEDIRSLQSQLKTAVATNEELSLVSQGYKEQWEFKNELWHEVHGQLTATEAKLDAAVEENKKLNLVLYHRENGLSHPDLQGEINKSVMAEKLKTAVKALERLAKRGVGDFCDCDIIATNALAAIRKDNK